MKAKLKTFIRNRAKNCCEYCISQERFSADSFSIEHIVSLSKGGSSNEQNLALSCQGCNNFKYNFIQAIDPATGAIVPLYNPRLDNWNSHFRYNETFTTIIGISQIGRATAQKLRLNRENLTNLRQVLTLLDLHPPF